jgi:hypothetical protein
MTPTDKANELFQKMLSKNPNRQEGISMIDTIQAKQCALIAVDEIVKEIQCNEFDFQSNVPMSVYTYWKNVKQEIQKL